jgi:hypothetical protein
MLSDSVWCNVSCVGGGSWELITFAPPLAVKTVGLRRQETGGSDVLSARLILDPIPSKRSRSQETPIAPSASYTNQAMFLCISSWITALLCVWR